MEFKVESAWNQNEYITNEIQINTRINLIPMQGVNETALQLRSHLRIQI